MKSPPRYPIGSDEIVAMRVLWRMGLNTKEIADRLRVPEYRVFNGCQYIPDRRPGNVPGEKMFWRFMLGPQREGR